MLVSPPIQRWAYRYISGAWLSVDPESVLLAYTASPDLLSHLTSLDCFFLHVENFHIPVFGRTQIVTLLFTQQLLVLSWLHVNTGWLTFLHLPPFPTSSLVPHLYYSILKVFGQGIIPKTLCTLGKHGNTELHLVLRLASSDSMWGSWHTCLPV